VRVLLAALLVLLAAPAHAAYQVTDIACETTATAGTGALTLAGAKSGGYLSFDGAGVTSGNTVPYTITTGSGATREIETGFGVFTSPATLTRVANWSSDGSGNELTLAGTSTVCIGPISGWFTLGAGSTLDADLLDGISSAGFLQDFNFTDDATTAGLAITEAETMTFAGDSAGIDTAGATNTLTISFDVTEAEANIEGAIDTLANLTSIQSLTVTLADAGANAFFGWDDAAGAYENLTTAEAEAIMEPLIDTLANLTSIQGSTFTLSNAATISDADKGDITTSSSFTDWQIDASAVTTTEISDGTIAEADLKVVDTPNDEECLEYESTTGDFEWEACGSGADQLGSDADRGDITISGGAGAVADIDPAITIDSTADAVDGIVWTFEHSDPTPDAADDPFEITVNAGDDQERVGAIQLELIDGATTTEDTSWRIFNDVAGSEVESMTLTGALASFPAALTAATSITSTAGDLVTGDDVLITDDIDFGTGDVQIAYSANDLDFTGVTGDYSFDDSVFVTGVVDASTDVDAGDDVIVADDIQLSAGALIDMGGGDVVITFAANDLDFTGVTGDYSFDDSVFVTGVVDASTDVDAGDDLIAADDIQLSAGALIDMGAGDVVITFSANDLAFSGVTGDYSFDDTVGVTGAATATGDVVAGFGDAAPGTGDLVSDDTGAVTLYEAEATGDNFIRFVAPASITSDATCTLENDSSPIPDSCVGDGSDSGGSVGDADYGDITVSSSGTVWDVDPVITVDSTADSADGIIWTFEHSDPSPDAADDPFEIIVNAGDDQEAVGLFRLELVDDATTTEDTYWAFTNDVAGTDTQSMIVSGLGSVVGPGTTLPVSGEGGLRLYSNNDSASGPGIEFHHDDPSADANDYILNIEAFGGADDEQLAGWHVRIIDPATTTEDTATEIWNDVAGASVLNMSLGNGVIIGAGTTFPGAGSLIVDNSLIVNHTAALGTWQGSSNTPAVQVLGTSFSTAAFGMARYTATATNSAAASTLYLNRAGSDVLGTHTLVASGDSIGRIRFEGSDGTDFAGAADITVEVDGSPGAGDMPGRLVFGTTPDASETIATRMTIKNDGGVIIGAGTTSPGNDGDLRLYNADDSAVGPQLEFHHNDPSADASDVAADIIVFGGADDEEAGSIDLTYSDPATGSEDAHWSFSYVAAGTLTTRLMVGASDPGAARLSVTAAAVIIDAELPLRFFEAEAGGDNYKGFVSAAANTADTTCTFENDANFIPDSCVGDGSDASDARLKKILNPANPIQVGALLDQVRIYDFEWTATSEKSEKVKKGDQGLGPMAQELFNVNSDWVEVGGEDPITQPWTWKPEAIVPYLIVEIQNLRKRVKELEAR
jgi:hypothetical protein